MPQVAVRRGRPRKFAVPSRAVTLTLPEHIIDALGTVDGDLSRAIVRVTERTRARTLRRRPAPAAELTHFGRHAVIVVSPTRTLAERTGVELVPLPDGRALISFPREKTIAEIELRLKDALEQPGLSAADVTTFRSILDILRDARRSAEVSLLQRSIIILEARRKRRRVRTGS